MSPAVITRLPSRYKKPVTPNGYHCILLSLAISVSPLCLLLLAWPGVLGLFSLSLRPRLPDIVSIFQLPRAAVSVSEPAHALLLRLGDPLLAHMVVIPELVSLLRRLLLIVLVSERSCCKKTKPGLLHLPNAGHASHPVGAPPFIKSSALARGRGLDAALAAYHLCACFIVGGRHVLLLLLVPSELGPARCSKCLAHLIVHQAGRCFPSRLGEARRLSSGMHAVSSFIRCVDVPRRI